MGKTLKRNVTVRKDYRSRPQAFKAGEELPEWAESLVGAHLFKEPAVTEKGRPVTKKTGLPSAPAPKVEKTEETNEVPQRSASKATWKKFAEKNGIEVPADAGRDDIVALVAVKFPELAE